MNSMPRFSILISTRRRTKGLDVQIRNILRTTKSLDSIEVIFCVELSDEETMDYFRINKFDFSHKILYVKDTDEYATKMNFIASISSGKILWLLADDTEIKTIHWDDIVWDKVNQSHWKIFLVKVKDSAAKEYSIVPMISRLAYETLGYFIDPRLYIWGSDKYTHHIFDRVGRVVKIDDVFVEETKIKDETAKSVEEAYNKHGSGSDLDYSEAIIKLKTAIDHGG